MATIDEYSLYLASWEHLYLLPNGVPAGLPNQLFSRHPWALILFENLYCDENGLKGEQNAAEQLNWTNSELFVKLSSPKYSIIQPLNLKSPLRPFVDDVKGEFKKEHKITVAKAIDGDTVSVDELFEWRLKLLRPFLGEHKLILYDWPVARYGVTIPTSLQMSVRDVLGLKAAAVPLSKDVTTELSLERKQIFDSLQEFEREPLRHLRSGRLPQPEYLEILKQRTKDYREVDMEMVEGIDQKLGRILRLRERFEKRGGWKLVRDYLQAYDREAHPKDLNEIDKALRDRLNYCFKPLLSEFGPATWHIAKGLVKGVVSLLPGIGEAMTIAETTNEVAKPAKELGGLMSETIQFFRGEIRRGKK
ncbi:MAG: hypothetical protein ACNYWU_10630 [Desulfobacterales bacterium]